MTPEAEFFDSLARRLESLHSKPEFDNEATRHDQLIHPILTSEWGLGWRHEDILSQPSIAVPDQVNESHIFRHGSPVQRRPDLLIAPAELGVRVAVIEEKKRQRDIRALDGYCMQVIEYQSLFKCVWGILSDGDRWIIRRNFENYHEFDSLAHFQRGLVDVRHCLSRVAVVDRWKKYQTCDLVVLVHEPARVILSSDANLDNSTDLLVTWRNSIELLQSTGSVSRVDRPSKIYDWCKLASVSYPLDK